MHSYINSAQPLEGVASTVLWGCPLHQGSSMPTLLIAWLLRPWSFISLASWGRGGRIPEIQTMKFLFSRGIEVFVFFPAGRGGGGRVFWAGTFLGADKAAHFNF